jgi:hypothetical protein
MRRNPVYVFQDQSSVGIFEVPIESVIQIVDGDGQGTPMMLQLISKQGLNPSSTIGEFLANDQTHLTLDNVIPSELEKIEVNNKIGWRLLGKEPANYGEIGEAAVDLSDSHFNGNYGAIGEVSFAAGIGTIAANRGSTALGRYNVGLAQETVLEVGIGTDIANVANGLEVHDDGTIYAPQATEALIDGRGIRTLVTKEYTDNKYIPIVEKGAPNGVAVLDANGLVPIEDLPPIAITSTYVCHNLSEQLSLSVEEGDVCVRTDESQSYIALNSDNASLLDWQLLMTPVDSVLSVNGKTGAVVLNTDDIAEGFNNLYFTKARVDDRMRELDTDILQEGANHLYYTDARVNAVWNTKDTDDLPEGGVNLYYTDQRVQYVISQSSTDNLQEGAVNLYYTDDRVRNVIANSTTDDLVEGNNNLYYTDARVHVVINNITSDDIVEGPHHLYFTNARADARANAMIAAATTNDLSEGTNHLYYTEARATANFNMNFAASDTGDLSEGINLYYTEARATANYNNNLAASTTDNLNEGTSNLYYTETRATANFNNNLAISNTDQLVEGNINFYYTDDKVRTVFNAEFTARTTDDLTEGNNNLYFTVARANDAFDQRLLLKNTDNLTEGSQNLYYTSQRVVDEVHQLTTDDLTEGSNNFYYTDERARTVAQAEITGSTTDDIAEGVANLYYTESRVRDVFDQKLALASTDDLQEGTNLYYTDARVDNRLGQLDTNILSEGSTNLYYTDTRADARIAAAHLADLADILSANPQDGDILKWDNVGSYWKPQPDLHVETTDDVAEGTNNLYFTVARVNDQVATLSINVLDDVDTVSTIPSNGDALKWNNSMSNWVPGSFDTDEIQEGAINLYYTDARADARIAAAQISNLSDVATSGVVNGEILKFNGANWVPGDLNTSEVAEDQNFLYFTSGRVVSVMNNTSIDELLDVDTSGVVSGRLLKYNGTNWVPGTLNTDEIPEGSSNLYYTDNRVRTLVGTLSTDDLAEGTTHLYYTEARVRDVISNSTTDDLAEGNNNLYYTQARDDANFATNLAASTTDNVQEGTTNLYYTEARDNANFATNLGNSTTDDVAEGTQHLYYTDDRVNDVIDVTSIDALTDVDTSTLAPQIGQTLKWDGTLWAPADDNDTVLNDTDDLAEGTQHLYYTDTRVDTRLGTTTIDILVDVDTSTLAPVLGQTLKWDGNNWVPADDDNNTYTAGDGLVLNGGSEFALNSDLGGLNDVDTTTQQANDLLRYNGTNWVPAVLDTDDIDEGSANLYYTDGRVQHVISQSDTDDLAEGSGNLYYTDARVIDVLRNASIDEMSDVDTTTDIPTNGQVLKWDATGSNWVPADATNVVIDSNQGTFTPTSIDETDGHFDYTLNQNALIDNVSNAKIGQKGMLVIKENSIGGWTLTWGSNYLFPGGAVPAINTNPDATNVFRFTVLASDKVLVEFIADF